MQQLIASEDIDYADTLLENLEKDISEASLPLGIARAIQEFPVNAGSKYQELDAKGTELWNLVSRLKRKHAAQEDGAVSHLLCLGLAFSFLLLDSAHLSAKGPISSYVRLMKVALKAARACNDLQENDVCLRVLEQAAFYDQELGIMHNRQTSADALLYDRLSTEYFIMRSVVAWKQLRLDFADHMYGKAAIASRSVSFPPDVVERLADMLFDIGKDLLNKCVYSGAVKWLERSHNLLLCQGMEALTNAAKELRLDILQSLVKALLGLDTDDGRRKASILTAKALDDFGEQFLVLNLKLAIIVDDNSSPAADYHHVLQRMVQIADITDASFKLLLQHIHKLNTRDTDLAGQALDNLIISKLLPLGKIEIIEKAFITRLWMASSHAQHSFTLMSLQTLFEAISTHLHAPLSASSTNAAQMVLWKMIESCYRDSQHLLAESWCLLANHKIFDNKGESNSAKISRKAIICCLARQDTVAARKAFNSMSKIGRAEGMTRYLMFKTAILDGDEAFGRSALLDLYFVFLIFLPASECLDIVSYDASDDASILHACVLEAQQAGCKRQAIVALQKVLEKHMLRVLPPNGVHLPALLRCTARLLLAELADNNARPLELVINDICQVFEQANAFAETLLLSESQILTYPFDTKELDWFSRTSFNLALKSCTEWEPQQTLRIIGSSIKFNNIFSSDSKAEAPSDVPIRQMHCMFLGASLLLSLARFETSDENQILIERIGPSLIAAGAVDKLSRWLRCLFQVAVPNDIGAAETCLVQAIHISSMMAGSSTTLAMTGLHEQVPLGSQSTCGYSQYPEEELQWLSSTAFNRAVEFYCSGEDITCKRWADHAIVLAGFCHDGGMLKSILEGNLGGLQFAPDNGSSEPPGGDAAGFDLTQNAPNRTEIRRSSGPQLKSVPRPKKKGQNSKGAIFSKSTLKNNITDSPKTPILKDPLSTDTSEEDFIIDLVSGNLSNLKKIASKKPPADPKPKPNAHSTSKAPLVSRAKPEPAIQEPWGIQKAALEKKFGDAGWLPRKRLSPDTLENIRALHSQNPQLYSTPALGEQFKVSPEAIRRILRTKWRPNEKQIEDRNARWDRRGERIWSRLVQLGVKPPKKWREMGVRRTPQNKLTVKSARMHVNRARRFKKDRDAIQFVE
ncbi:MAG: hypothetical protein M1829_002470 [Trizodia sp. TS-e1964]|nr:MAG: hypothetical protein M1829_002470 [Trizodia sp. TS-e1964]